MEILVIAFGVIIVLFGILFYNSFIWGLVGYKFWYWFLLPIFTTLPEVSYLQVVGLMFFIGLFKNYFSESIKKKYRDTGTEVEMFLLGPWLTLLFGWIIHIIIY